MGSNCSCAGKSSYKDRQNKYKTKDVLRRPQPNKLISQQQQLQQQANNINNNNNSYNNSNNLNINNKTGTDKASQNISNQYDNANSTGAQSGGQVVAQQQQNNVLNNINNNNINNVNEQKQDQDLQQEQLNTEQYEFQQEQTIQNQLQQNEDENEDRGNKFISQQKGFVFSNLSKDQSESVIIQNQDQYFNRQEQLYYQQKFNLNTTKTSQFLLTDQQRISWRKMENLGTGACGDVAKGMISGINPGFPLYFAVKQVFVGAKGDRNVQRINQVKNEIRLLSTLKHKNIIRYLGFQQEDNNLNIFMELGVDTLKSKTLKYKQLPEQFVRRIMEEILLGLEYLHAHNIMHRDLKTANILFVNEKVKLADFGSAKQIQKANSTYGEQFKSLIGTPQYMAPEVIRQNGRGRFSDIFSVGCIFYELLTGKQLIPEKYKTMEEVINYIKRYDVKPEIQNKISDYANDFLLKCLKQNPLERPNVYQLLRHPYITNKSMPENNLSSTHKGNDNSSHSQNISKALNSCIKFHENQNQDPQQQINNFNNNISQENNYMQSYLQSKKQSSNQNNNNNFFAMNMQQEKLQQNIDQNQNWKKMNKEEIKQMMRDKQLKAKQQLKINKANNQNDDNDNDNNNKNVDQSGRSQFPMTRQDTNDIQNDREFKKFLVNIPRSNSENVPQNLLFNRQKTLERQRILQQLEESQKQESQEQIIQFDDDDDENDDQEDLMDVNEINENDSDKRKELDSHQYDPQNKRNSIFSSNSQQKSSQQARNLVTDNRNINLLRGRSSNNIQNDQYQLQQLDDTDSVDQNKHNIPPIFGLSRNQTEFLPAIDDEEEETQIIKSKMKAIYEIQEVTNNKSQDFDSQKRSKIQQMTYEIQNEISDNEDDDIIDIEEYGRSGNNKDRRQSQKGLKQQEDKTQNDPKNVLYNPGPLRQQYSSDKNHPKFPKFMDTKLMTLQQQRDKYQNLKKQINLQQDQQQQQQNSKDNKENSAENDDNNLEVQKQNSISNFINGNQKPPMRKFGLKRQSQQQQKIKVDEFKTYNGGNQIKRKFEFNSISGQNQDSDDGGILNTQEDQNNYNSNYSAFTSNNQQKYYSYGSVNEIQFQQNLKQNTGSSQKNKFTTNNTNHDNFKSFATNSTDRKYFNANDSFNQQQHMTNQLNNSNYNVSTPQNNQNNQNNFASSNGTINHQFQSVNSNQGQQNFYSFNNNNNIKGGQILNDIQEQDELQGSSAQNQSSFLQQEQLNQQQVNIKQFNTIQNKYQQNGQRPGLSRFQRASNNNSNNQDNLI